MRSASATNSRESISISCILALYSSLISYKSAREASESESGLNYRPEKMIPSIYITCRQPSHQFGFPASTRDSHLLLSRHSLSCLSISLSSALDTPAYLFPRRWPVTGTVQSLHSLLQGDQSQSSRESPQIRALLISRRSKSTSVMK